MSALERAARYVEQRATELTRAAAALKAGAPASDKTLRAKAAEMNRMAELLREVAAEIRDLPND